MDFFCYFCKEKTVVEWMGRQVLSHSKTYIY